MLDTRPTRVLNTRYAIRDTRLWCATRVITRSRGRAARAVGRRGEETGGARATCASCAATNCDSIQDTIGAASSGPVVVSHTRAGWPSASPGTTSATAGSRGRSSDAHSALRPPPPPHLVRSRAAHRVVSRIGGRMRALVQLAVEGAELEVAAVQRQRHLAPVLRQLRSLGLPAAAPPRARIEHGSNTVRTRVEHAHHGMKNETNHG